MHNSELCFLALLFQEETRAFFDVNLELLCNCKITGKIQRVYYIMTETKGRNQYLSFLKRSLRARLNYMQICLYAFDICDKVSKLVRVTITY